jgi:hypothetical protein
MASGLRPVTGSSEIHASLRLIDARAASRMWQTLCSGRYLAPPRVHEAGSPMRSSVCSRPFLCR